MAIQELLAGNLPSFLATFVPIHISIKDSSTGKNIKATYFVSTDYISIGSDKDWARIPLTPMAAQKLVDAWQCFLPTRKISDDIYKAAKVKPEPVPMYAFRDSTPTMYQHHLIIEGQRKGRKGLTAGIKKDIVISGKISRDTKQKSVAIYGWHKPDGKAIQPLYTGHVNWYVDYSHGIRLVYQQVKVNNKWMDYTDVLNDPILKRLLCDEEYCDFYAFFDQHPNAWVFASGNTAARTRLYQMGIGNYYEEIKDDLEIYGQIEDEWHPFEKKRDYLAFLARLKTS